MKKFFIILSFILVVCLFTASCGNSDTPSTSQNTDNNNQQQEQNQEVEIPENFKIGDTATFNNWEISVTEFSFKDKLADNDYFYFSPDEGNKFAVVSLQITNTNKEAQTFLPSFSYGDDIRARICFADEYVYQATNLIGYEAELHDSTMNPLTTKNGVIAFDVPEIVTTSEESLVFTIYAGQDSISFDLR